MRYEILKREKGREIRRYPPVKRTVKIMNRFYNLQFPHIVFEYCTYDADDDEEASGQLSVWFSDGKDKAYNVPMPNVGEEADVCLNNGRSEYATNFDEAVEQFWTHAFNDWLKSETCLKDTFGRFHVWAKMSLEEVNQHLGSSMPLREVLSSERHLYNYDYDDGGRLNRTDATQAKNLAKNVLSEAEELKRMMMGG